MNNRIGLDENLNELEGGTGFLGSIPEKIVTCRLGDFSVKVLLTQSNEFLGIKEISKIESWRSEKNMRFHDLGDIYPED